MNRTNAVKIIESLREELHYEFDRYVVGFEHDNIDDPRLCTHSECRALTMAINILNKKRKIGNGLIGG